MTVTDVESDVRTLIGGVERLGQRAGKAEQKVVELERDLKEAEEEVEQAETRAVEAEEDVRYANQLANLAEHRLDSVRAHIWRNDRPGATYCVSCGQTWPIHKHDCPLGEVV